MSASYESLVENMFHRRTAHSAKPSSSTMKDSAILPSHIYEDDDDKKYHHTSTGKRRYIICMMVLFALFCGCGYLIKCMPSEPRMILGRRQAQEIYAVNSTDWPLVQIVHTRFMQEQSHLHALANARLTLFETFCFPTMAHQSSQRFLWIFQADPNLDVVLLDRLQTLFQPYPNFYLVLSNKNFRINRQFPGAWRGGAEIEDLRKSRILTGSQSLLEQAMMASESKHVLETRLDADDGLHVDFIKYIQQRALYRFKKSSIRWMYWCTRRHLEWHWMDSPKFPHGALTGMKHDKLCITPGITVGFPKGTAEPDVPIFAHDKIVVTLRDMAPQQGCGAKSALDCLEFIESHMFEAIRSRTPTSAGMLHVGVDREQIEGTTEFINYAFWDMAHDMFRIDRQRIKSINYYLTSHLIEIARDNLMGQCTSGHSCKVCHVENTIILRSQRIRDSRSETNYDLFRLS